MIDFAGIFPILNVKDLFSSVSRGKVSIFVCQGAQGRPRCK
jgi:hypothetical protein